MLDVVESSPIIKDVWSRSYCRGDANILGTFQRVAKAISLGKRDDEQAFLNALSSGLFMPGGRIIAGAGTNFGVTLMNCYVSPDIPDDLEGIADAHKVAMLTQQQGGGIGMDFSTLRPSGALLRRTGSIASGPLPFMDHWDAMCSTIRSAGDRRGAMMGTICDTHPDLPAFIVAKHKQGRLTNFNVSVLVSDAFMGAVQDDEDWELYFHVPPADTSKILGEFDDEEGQKQYIYQRIKARALWDAITASTYVYSEPGVIFIDRINELNNLKYVEHIHCTNPCGEQPLPANGTCNLGAINLARLVKEPFKSSARFDYDTLKSVSALAVRFLDNVIDVTKYPTGEQASEEYQKRRLGLGISGLASAMAQLSVRYGSSASVSLAREVMRTIAISSYEASSKLAEERGSFPLFDDSKFFGGFAGEKLPSELVEQIHQNGIRNGVILTIAPTGTTSILYGNIPSGIEPIFAFKQDRKVRMDNTEQYQEYKGVPEYTTALYQSTTGGTGGTGSELPDYFVESKDLNVEEHVRIQAACQEWVDASVSKTINCPEDISFETFQEVYSLAYERGCKGCTTYRPSEIRGSILIDPNANRRPDMLDGCTYKIKWPSWESAIYVTVNDHKGRPYEVFIASKDARYQEWIIAISILVSIIVRKADDPLSIISELKQIQSTHDSAFLNKKRYGSVLARIAEVIEMHLEGRKQGGPNGNSIKKVEGKGDLCPKCYTQMLRREGCSVCPACSHTTCG
jgi:ribonucleoside-diphosphate reductase alpha chain